MVYVFCAEWEVKYLRDLVKRHSNKKHLISPSIDSFLSTRGPVYYTEASVEDNHKQFLIFRRHVLWNEGFLPFPIQNYTLLGRFLNGKE